MVYNNYIALLSLQKEFQLMTINLFGAWSNLNDDEQYQAGFSLTIYPLGNLNFYGTSTFLNHHEHGRNNFIFDQVVGFRIASPLWAEIYGTFGPQNNYYEKNALIVYNIPDQINFKGGGRLMLTLARNWLLSLDYQYLEKEGKLLTYEQTISENGLTLKPEYFQFKYHNHLISAGVQWKF